MCVWFVRTAGNQVTLGYILVTLGCCITSGSFTNPPWVPCCNSPLKIETTPPAMPAGGTRSLCAVRAVGALCAECGPEGAAWSRAPQPGAPPWKWKNSMQLCDGASAKRTVETFASLFGWDGLKPDADGKRFSGAAALLNQRAADVKRVIDGGFDAVQLHAKLSHAAWNASALCGTTLVHTASGECPACAVCFPLEYKALQPQSKPPGRKPKQQRVSRCKKGIVVQHARSSFHTPLKILISKIRSIFPSHHADYGALCVRRTPEAHALTFFSNSVPSRCRTYAIYGYRQQ